MKEKTCHYLREPTDELSSKIKTHRGIFKQQSSLSSGRKNESAETPAGKNGKSTQSHDQIENPEGVRPW